MAVPAFWQVWFNVSGLASGVFFLLVGYRVVRVGDEKWQKRNGKLLRVFGFVCILGSIFLAVFDYIYPTRP
jgi:hypothetical protein